MTTVHAQEQRNALSVDLFLPAMSPLSQLAGEDMTFVPLNLMYQRLLGEHYALMMKLGLTYSYATNGDRIVETSPMLALHWHPFASGLQGFYLGPAVVYSHSDYAYSGTPARDDLDHSDWTALGANVGYQYTSPSGTLVNMIVGLGYGPAHEVYVTGRSKSYKQTDEISGGIYVGYAF